VSVSEPIAVPDLKAIVWAAAHAEGIKRLFDRFRVRCAGRQNFDRGDMTADYKIASHDLALRRSAGRLDRSILAHIRQRGRLAFDAVNARRDRVSGWIAKLVGGHEPRTITAGRLEILAQSELTVV
jgi:hypothetical protein